MRKVSIAQKIFVKTLLKLIKLFRVLIAAERKPDGEAYDMVDNFRKIPIFLIALFAIMVLIGCNRLDTSIVESDFKKRYPNATLLSITETEGDSTSVYFQIEFKSGNNNQTVEWLYQKSENSEWIFKGEYSRKSGTDHDSQ
jgi:hypothetical protein